MKTSHNICITRDFGNSLFFKAECECMSNEHAHTLILEHDTEIKDITLTMYTNFYVKEWWKYDRLKWYEFWKKPFLRIQLALKMLFTDEPIEMESAFMWWSKDGIKSYIEALQEGLNKIESDQPQPKWAAINLTKKRGKSFI